MVSCENSNLTASAIQYITPTGVAKLAHARYPLDITFIHHLRFSPPSPKLHKAMPLRDCRPEGGRFEWIRVLDHRGPGVLQAAIGFCPPAAFIGAK
jgi:hypothetical protein